MTILEAVLQGIVQGLTEFLPVSSSGHLSLFQHFFGLDGENAVTMTIILHLGTLVAVFVAFWDKIKVLVLEAFRLLRDLFKGKFRWKEMNHERRMIMMIIVSLLPLLIFYIFKDFFDNLASDDDILIEGFAFLYTSALLFASTRIKRDNSYSAGETTVKNALTIGVFQGIALTPGISRSGSTICSALFTGMKREDAVDYSFILGIPVIIAGAFVKLFDLTDSAADELKANFVPLAVSFVISAVAGYFAIRLIKAMVVNDKFRVFAWYTLVLGIAVVGIGIYENISGVRIMIG